MARYAGNNMHNDAYMSDTYKASGPLGGNPQVTSRTQGFGGYGTLAFDSQGRIVAVYSNGRAFQLEVMDPYTLEELAAYDLPPRSWTLAPARYYALGVSGRRDVLLPGPQGPRHCTDHRKHTSALSKCLT